MFPEQTVNASSCITLWTHGWMSTIAMDCEKTASLTFAVGCCPLSGVEAANRMPGQRVARSSRILLLLTLLIWFGLYAWSLDKTIQGEAAPIKQITIGDSTISLNGPWKFHIGDSPL